MYISLKPQTEKSHRKFSFAPQGFLRKPLLNRTLILLVLNDKNNNSWKSPLVDLGVKKCNLSCILPIP
jgi:hypothetical protein